MATPGVQREIYVVETQPIAAGTTVGSFQLRVIPHASLPQSGPGLAANGNFVLTAVEAYLGDERLPLVSACSTHAQPGIPAAALVDDNPGTAWAINVAPGSPRKMNAEHTAWVSLPNAVRTDGRPLKFVLKHELNNDYNLGRFHLSWSSDLVDATSDASLLEALTDRRRTNAPRNKSKSWRQRSHRWTKSFRKRRGESTHLRRQWSWARPSRPW